MSKRTFEKQIFVNKAKNNSADIFIIGDICDYEWDSNDVTPEKILNSLKEINNAKTINLFVNSYGGSVVAGVAISNLLEKYRSDNKVKIVAEIGVACSMGSVIPMIADTIRIHKNGCMMLHKPLCNDYGNATDKRKTAELLDMWEKSLTSMYMRRFKGTEEALAEMLEQETWLTAEEALECGLVDEIIEPLEMVAKADSLKIGNALFTNAELINRYTAYTKENAERKESKMRYSDTLNDYGISQETFEAFDDAAQLVSLITAKANADVQTEIEIVKNSSVGEIEVFKEALEVENITADEILAFAVKGKGVDVDTEAKIKAYDELLAEYNDIVQEKVESALNAARVAMGVEGFQEEVWRKALNGMSYKDVCTTEIGWTNQAKKSVNAGGRVSAIEDSKNIKGEKIDFTPRKGDKK